MVVLHRSGIFVEIGGELLSLEFTDEDFGETWFGGGSASGAVPPFCRVMNGEGGLVQIAFELKPGLLQKALVVWIVRHRRQVANRFQGPQPLDVYVKEAVCTGQKPGCLRRSTPP